VGFVFGDTRISGVRRADYPFGAGGTNLQFMETVDGWPRRNFWYWKKDSAGVPLLVLAGDLDFEVSAELAATLGAVPPPSASTIDVDCGGVTFLDARTAILLGRYRAAARRLGKQVRIVNAVGMPRAVLTVLGVLPAESASGSEVTSPGPHSRPPSTDHRTIAADVFARARSAVARSQELIREAERLLEVYGRRGRG
jgi:anti-anti-sigma regulatory factor